MLPSLWILLWAVLAALTAAAGWIVYAKRRRLLRQARLSVDDEAIRRILDTGELFVEEDEPLDLESIHEEEERFWSETWDEPEEA